MSAEYYQGLTFVHWNMTIDERRTGWLDQTLHLTFREVLLHTLSRYSLLCPVYCLMPDHMHMLWFGLSPSSDQNKAASFFRTYMTVHLRERNVQFQRQAWDVVLREKDRERDALVKTACYIVQNPIRKDLVAVAEEWPYSGSAFACYPDIDWRQEDYPQRLWRVYDEEVRRRG
jgi:REP element-mobilizing transposase RayT